MADHRFSSCGSVVPSGERRLNSFEDGVGHIAVSLWTWVPPIVTHAIERRPLPRPEQLERLLVGGALDRAIELAGHEGVRCMMHADPRDDRSRL